ncbi:Uncharacterised protein [Escherichia coli]|uniref:Uncharacterized protein n=1 Tax=Escherichia coli TaxID=562 RepID=A0A377B7E2_ECOLX|nr:Uncharacterised protein [Escherichia coli]
MLPGTAWFPGYFFQHFRDVSPIDVRNKVHVQVVFVRTQSFGHHVWAEVRTPIPMFTTSVIALPV